MPLVSGRRLSYASNPWVYASWLYLVYTPTLLVRSTIVPFNDAEGAARALRIPLRFTRLPSATRQRNMKKEQGRTHERQKWQGMDHVHHRKGVYPRLLLALVGRLFFVVTASFDGILGNHASARVYRQVVGGCSVREKEREKARGHHEARSCESCEVHTLTQH